jgi:DHA1 family quinolone resistance protein-like MFS transporter
MRSKGASTLNTVRRAQWTYYLVLALFWFATSLPAALGVLIIQSRGFPLHQIGLFLGIYTLTIVLLEVPTGGLADAVGRKRVALLAYAVTAAGSASYFFAYSAWAFALTFALNGVGRALSSGALDAWFVDAVQGAAPDIDLQPLLAHAGTVSLFALGLGTLLGSALPMLFTHLPPDGTALLTPLTTPLIGSFAGFLLAFVATLVLVREDRGHLAPKGWRDGILAAPETVKTALRLSRRNPTIVLLVTATMASAFAILSLELLWQPRFAELVGGAAERSVLFGIIMAGNFIAGMVGNMFAPIAGRMLGKRYALVAALFQAARGGAMLLLAYQTSLVPAVAVFWLVYLGMGVVNSPHGTLLNAQIPAEYRSSMLSVDSLLGYVGGFLSSVLMGYVATWAGIPVAWAGAGVVLLLSVGLYLRVDAREQAGAAPVSRVAVSNAERYD